MRSELIKLKKKKNEENKAMNLRKRKGRYMGGTGGKGEDGMIIF